MDSILDAAEVMFPEGVNRGPTAYPRRDAAAEKSNELLVNAEAAVDALWKRRGYDPKKPEVIKAKLGYALDRYEAAAYLVTGAVHLPLLSQPEAMLVGKRIKNITGPSGTIGSKLKGLRKRGKVAAPQIAALLRAPATLNLDPPPRRAAPPPPPPPPPAPPLQPPRPQMPARPTQAAARAEGVIGVSPNEEMAHAVEAADHLEDAWREVDNWLEPCEEGDDDYEDYISWCEEVDFLTLRYSIALRRLWRATPELQQWSVQPKQLAQGARAADWNSTPCACGGGGRLDLPFVVRRPEWGFCECEDAHWHVCSEREAITRAYWTVLTPPPRVYTDHSS